MEWNKLTQKRLKQNYIYDKNTGIFTKTKLTEKGFKRKHPDKSVGSINSMGYLRIFIDKKRFLNHRLAWLYVYGYMPNEIDHINGNKSDNRICNLRNVTKIENLKNKCLMKGNKSGFHDVRQYGAHNKYRVRIGINGKRIHIGVYNTKEEATIARKEAEVKYNFHKNHGRLI